MMMMISIFILNTHLRIDLCTTLNAHQCALNAFNQIYYERF